MQCNFISAIAIHSKTSGKSSAASKERIRNRFNAAVAEVDDQALWQRSVLGVAVVSSAVEHCDEMLTKIVNFVEGDPRVYILDYQMEVH